MTDVLLTSLLILRNGGKSRKTGCEGIGLRGAGADFCIACRGGLERRGEHHYAEGVSSDSPASRGLASARWVGSSISSGTPTGFHNQRLARSDGTPLGYLKTFRHSQRALTPFATLGYRMERLRRTEHLRSPLRLNAETRQVLRPEPASHMSDVFCLSAFSLPFSCFPGLLIQTLCRKRI